MTVETLDGLRMRVVSVSRNSEIGEATRFLFNQRGEVVSARYSGGRVNLGFLVGTFDSNGLKFAYAQLGNDGRVNTGVSNCDVFVTEDGHVRLVERFMWETASGGGHILEEIKDAESD